MYRYVRMQWFETRVVAARTTISMLLVLLVLLTAVSAEAQVAFQAPPHCGSHQEFFASVRDLQQVEAAQITLTSVVITEPEPGTYHLILDGPDGSREFTDVDCRTLFRTAVVVAAAAARTPAIAPVEPIAPDAVEAVEGERGSEPASSSPVAPPPTAPPSPASPEPVPPASAPRASAVLPTPFAAQAAPADPDGAPNAAATADPPPAVSVAGGLGAALGLSPHPTLVFDLEGGLGRGAWGVVVNARYLTPSEATTQGDAGVRVESFGGRAAAHYRVVSRLRVAGGLSAYRIQARGVGIRYPNTDVVWLIAPEIEVALGVPLSTEWSVVLGLAGRVGFTMPSFQIQPEIEVFQLPRVGGLGVFRVEWAPR